MNELKKVVALLEDPAMERRIAAAIVLGAIEAKGVEVVEGLAKLLDSPVPSQQRHALDALARIGARKLVPKIFPLLASKDHDVRRAAAAAIASVGDDAVPMIRERMKSSEADEKRALDAILAEVGGKDAFTALLQGVALRRRRGQSQDSGALAVGRKRGEKGPTRPSGASTSTEIERFLDKKPRPSANAVAAAVKILGYLEDEKTLPLLLSYATSKKEPSAIRQEALIAMRFALSHSKGGAGKLVGALLDAAADDDRALSQIALHTLGSLELSAEHAKKLEALIQHREIDRARFVLEQLGRQKGGDAAKTLVRVLATGDKVRAEIAATALAGNEGAAAMLTKALLDAADADRAWMIRNVLRPSAKKIAPASRKELIAVAIERLGEGERNWEALLDVARDADPDGVATALRALAAKLKKQDHRDKALAVLTILCRSDRATDDDRYARVALELGKSVRDTRPASRAGDESLRTITALLARGFDVAKALRTDKTLGLDELYYVGFHFVEDGHPLGEEMLTLVAERGGRAKIGKMAKNKLALTEG